MKLQGALNKLLVPSKVQLHLKNKTKSFIIFLIEISFQTRVSALMKPMNIFSFRFEFILKVGSISYFLFFRLTSRKLNFIAIFITLFVSEYLIYYLQRLQWDVIKCETSEFLLL